MIREAKKKLRGRQVDFHCLDLASADWSDKWDGSSFDAVVSVLVLEHLDPLAYESCLSQFLRILKPGGALVAVEGYAGKTLQELFFHEMAVAETNAVRNGAITQELLTEIKRRSAEEETHHYTTMDEKKAWWLAQGFVGVEFIWQYYCAAILTGRKPS
jgi:SAM-dependent methyltransferase